MIRECKRHLKVIEKLKNDGYKIYYENGAYYENMPYIINKNGTKTYLAYTIAKHVTMHLRHTTSYTQAKIAIKYCLGDTNEAYELRKQIDGAMALCLAMSHDWNAFGDMTGLEIYNQIKNMIEAPRNFTVDYLNGELELENLTILEKKGEI